MLKNKVAAGAEGLLRRALAIYEKALDPKHDERLLADYYSGIKEMALDPVEFSTKENYLEHVKSLQSLPTYAEAGPLYEEMKIGPKGIEPDDTLSARYQTLYVRLRMRQYMRQYRGCGGRWTSSLEPRIRCGGTTAPTILGPGMRLLVRDHWRIGKAFRNMALGRR